MTIGRVLIDVTWKPSAAARPAGEAAPARGRDVELAARSLKPASFDQCRGQKRAEMRADVRVEHAGVPLHAGVDRLSCAGIELVHGNSQCGQLPSPLHRHSQLAAVGPEPAFSDHDVVQALPKRAADMIVADCASFLGPTSPMMSPFRNVNRPNCDPGRVRANEEEKRLLAPAS